MLQRLTIVVLAAISIFVQPLPAQPPASPPAPADPPRLEFSSDATPGKPFTWTSQPTDGQGNTVGAGLDYVWSLPASYQPGTSYDLLIVIHSVGKDARWGHAAIDPAALGKDMIVISPAGTSVLTQGVRSFSDNPADYLAFREFMLEMTRTFPADRIVLFGYEQGGGFALRFAEQFPSLAEGVVVQGTRPWINDDNQREPSGIKQIPIVILQGTADETMPYSAAAAAREYYVKHEHLGVWLRPLYNCGHDPGAHRIGEAVDWCIGMQNQEPEIVLETANRLLKPTTTTEPCTAAPPLGAACQLLRRLLGDTENNTAHFPLDEVDPQVRASATTLLSEIDSHVARHLTQITLQASKPGDFVLNGKPWLGHLLCLQEDCRGVRAFDAFALSSGFAQLQDSQSGAAASFAEAWAAPTPKERFERVLDALPGCFLLADRSPGFVSQMKAWRAKASELNLSEESLERFENIIQLEQASRDGFAQYRELWNAKVHP